MADIESLDRKLTLVLQHLEHIEKNLNLPPLSVEESAPKREKRTLTAKNVHFIDN
jgi:hypothetical protein